jgi:hypothetical protein
VFRENPEKSFVKNPTGGSGMPFGHHMGEEEERSVIITLMDLYSLAVL